MTMDEIRERYPHPVAPWGTLRPQPYSDDPYCVGAAVVRMAAVQFHQFAFVAPWCVGVALRRFNPHLSSDAATAYGRQIIVENDKGRFADAWAVVELALKDRGEPAASPDVEGGTP